jgi:hypothetical protein
LSAETQHEATFWDATPSGQVEIYCLCFPGSPFNSGDVASGVSPQKTVFFIVTAMRTLNLKQTYIYTYNYHYIYEIPTCKAIQEDLYNIVKRKKK